MSEESDFDQVINNELKIINPVVRGNERLIRKLLHPDFLEFGASSISASAILLTFKCKSGGRETLRSSVWLKSETDEWLLRFHQGTIVGDR